KMVYTLFLVQLKQQQLPINLLNIEVDLFDF
ncbi:MAG: hypothetical protein RLZZ569_1142, partial [Bacteroidota bacterium]